MKIADALEALRDDLATGEMPVEEAQHRLTLLADRARGAEPVARAAGELLALPERLRAAVSSCLTREEVLGALESAWPAVEAEVRAAGEGEIADRIEAMATEDLSPEPEAPAADRDPATVTVRWTCPRPSCGREHEWEWSEDDIPLGGAISRMHCESCPAVTLMVAHRVPGGVRMIEPWPPAVGEPMTPEQSARDRLWCQALCETLDPREINRVTSRFQELRTDGGASAAGELPAGWGELRAVMNKALNELPDYRSGRVYGLVPKELVLGAVSAALKPLWPAPLPPAAREAIEAALRCVAVCEGCGATEIDVLEPDGDGGHARSEPGPGSEPVPVHCGPVTIRFDAALQALRSVELASAARAQRLHDGIEAAILRLQGRDGDGAYDALDAALDAAPPSDPWAALMALLADLDADAERREVGAARILAHHSEAREVARRIRAAHGLPPKESDHG